MKMSHKIPISGCILRRNDCKAVRKQRKIQFLLKVHKPFLLQAFYCHPAFLLLQSERKIRVDIIYNQGQPVQLAEIH
ncbi:hypothetical protein EVA_17285 [gut metagenome]|uniref:Uncharacterized protein n=1 Tax=gut metagenome TaxID=749906 RepID=J9FJM5_9ZZZZ